MQYLSVTPPEVDLNASPQGSVENFNPFLGTDFQNIGHTAGFSSTVVSAADPMYSTPVTTSTRVTFSLPLSVAPREISHWEEQLHIPVCESCGNSRRISELKRYSLGNNQNEIFYHSTGTPVTSPVWEESAELLQQRSSPIIPSSTPQAHDWTTIHALPQSPVVTQIQSSVLHPYTLPQVPQGNRGLAFIPASPSSQPQEFQSIPTSQPRPSVIKPVTSSFTTIPSFMSAAPTGLTTANQTIRQVPTQPVSHPVRFSPVNQPAAPSSPSMPTFTNAAPVRLTPVPQSMPQVPKQVFHPVRRSQFPPVSQLSNPQITPGQPTFGHPGFSLMSQQSSYKLPKVELPKFNGEFEEWTSFWEQFKTFVHDDPGSTDVVKFSRLKSLLSGEATECISGLSLTSDHYALAIDILHETYGDPEKIETLIFEEVDHIDPPMYNSASLTTFRRRFIALIRKVSNIKQYPEIEYHLKMKLLQCLPSEAKEEIYRHVRRTNLSLEEYLMELQSVIKLLNQTEAFKKTPPLRITSRKAPVNQASTMSSIQTIQSNATSTANQGTFTKSHIPQKRNFNSQGRPARRPRTSINNHRQSSSPPRFRSNSGRSSPLVIRNCIFCGEDDHNTTSCYQYITRDDRLNRLSDLRRCFICLSTRHATNDCSNEVRCFRCEQTGHVGPLCNTLWPVSRPISPTAQSEGA